MPWREALSTVRMERVALVAPTSRLHDALLLVGDAGVVELDPIGEGAPTGAERATGPMSAADLRQAAVAERSRGALVRDEVAALAGWAPADAVPVLAADLARVGGAVVPLPRPRGVDAPTLLRGAELRRSLSPLVETYGTVPYADVDPTVLAAITYVLMFGMMFGDVGHGLLVIALALALRVGRPRLIKRFRRAWPLVAGAGLASTLFGFLYGEAFGPTGLVPVLWLKPLEEPIPLLVAAIALGGVLLAGSYALGTINRWREGGWPMALFARSGVAGASLFAGVGMLAAGWYLHQPWFAAVGALTTIGGLALAFTGFYVEAGGGGTAVVQALVELFDTVVRLGSNTISFTRLAAFGLTHAALGLVVWDATTAMWAGGLLAAAAAVVVFVVGNAIAFALEALVAAVQALRLEYYELFSKVFQSQGRPFRPWRLPPPPGRQAQMVPPQERSRG